MKQPIKFLVDVFLALGAMIDFSPQADRRRENMPDLEVGQEGIERHFVAAWGHLENAVLQDEE